MSASLARKYNCIHQQMYMVRRLAEENCRTTPSGKVPWSPKLQGFRDRLTLWKLLLKGRKHCRVSSRKVLRRLMKKTRLSDAWRKPTAELEECLHNERLAYKQAKRQATQLRRASSQPRRTMQKRRNGSPGRPTIDSFGYDE